jgi:hypothetical protein
LYVQCEVWSCRRTTFSSHVSTHIKYATLSWVYWKLQDWIECDVTWCIIALFFLNSSIN